MASEGGSSNRSGILIPGLFLLFLGLKLGGVIDWSWWWVTAPLWGTILFAMLVVCPIVFVYKVLKAIAEDK